MFGVELATPVDTYRIAERSHPAVDSAAVAAIAACAARRSIAAIQSCARCTPDGPVFTSA